MLFSFVQCELCEHTVLYESRSHKLKFEQTCSLSLLILFPY
jgi:hypothetical protein